MEAKLIQIAKDREITQKTDPEFWFICQQSVLLALKELGLLNERAAVPFSVINPDKTTRPGVRRTV